MMHADLIDQDDLLGQLRALGFESPMPYRVDGPSRMLAQVTSAQLQEYPSLLILN